MKFHFKDVPVWTKSRAGEITNSRPWTNLWRRLMAGLKAGRAIDYTEYMCGGELKCKGSMEVDDTSVS